MKPKQDAKVDADKFVRNLKRATRRTFGAEEKIRIVLAGLRGEDSIAELCRREGLHQNLYYRWSKEFLAAGKKRLAGDTEREASSGEVSVLRKESAQLKEALAETMLENRLLKKSVLGTGEHSSLVRERTIHPRAQTQHQGGHLTTEKTVVLREESGVTSTHRAEKSP